MKNKYLLMLLLVPALLFVFAGAVSAGNTYNVAKWTNSVIALDINATGPTVLFDNVTATYHMWYANKTNEKVFHTSSTDPASFTNGTAVTGLYFNQSCPFVMKEDDTYYMINYESTTIVFSIFTSIDGINWTAKGKIFNGTGISNLQKMDRPKLLKETDGTYKMYFQIRSNETVSLPYYIYLANTNQTTLDSIADGDNDTDFTLVGTTPVLSPSTTSTDWDGSRVMQPMVVKEGSNYYMWYVGYNSSTPALAKIGFAFSSDGINWTKNPGNPILAGVYNVWTPSILKINNTYHLWNQWDGTAAGSNPRTIQYISANSYFQFPSIQEAINAASSGDTINVAAGTYNEQILIGKPLTLNGVGDTTIIKPSNLTKYITTPSVAGSTVCTGAVIVNNSNGAVIVKNLKVDASSLNSNRTKWFSPTVNLMKFAGVFYYNSNGTIDNVISTNTNHITIETTGATTWGRQVQSFKIDDANTTTPISVELKNSEASNFLGEAISVGWNTPTATQTVNIHNNTIIGDGSVINRRQNGIYVYYGYMVTAISNNTISNLVYRSGTNWATGIVVADVKSGAMIEYNNISNCDFGITDTYSSGVTIQHNTITGSDQTYGTGIYLDNGPASITGIVVHANTIGSGFPYGGIGLRGWYAGSNTISETISDNVLTGDGTNDGYGFYDDSGAAGAITSTITGNTITGWTKGISIESGAPVSGLTLINNSISGNTNYNLDNQAAGMINATHNYWGSALDSVVNSSILGNVTYHPYYIDEEMTRLATKGEEDPGNITLDPEKPYAVIINSTNEVTIVIEDETEEPMIDFSGIVDNGTVEAPNITITSSIAEINIPATNITSENSSWNGVLSAPTVTTITLPSVSGETRTLSSAVEIGLSDTKLSFDNAVRILLPGEKDKRVGYSRTGVSFTEITAVCEGDNQTWADANLTADSECKMNVGNDLVVWTKHFTTFATFSSTAVVSSAVTSNSGGGSSCTYNQSYDWGCLGWSECVNGFQTRECKKYNNCRNTYGKPETNKTCAVSATLIVENNNSGRKILFDIGVKINKKTLFVNEKLSSTISLINLGVPGKVNVTAYYQIIDDKGEVVYEENEIIPVETQLEFLKEFDTSRLNEGTYTLIAEIKYEGQKEPARADDSFVVNKTFMQKFGMVILLVLGVVLICLLVIWIMLKDGVYIKRIAKKVHVYFVP